MQMQIIRWIGIAILLGGVACFVASDHIGDRLVAGRQRVESGQSQIDSGRELFSFTPLTEIVGDQLTAPAQEQVNQGRQKIAHYETLADKVHNGGIWLVVIGF